MNKPRKADSWWVTTDDAEFTRRARVAAARMASSHAPSSVDNYFNRQIDRGCWRLPVRDEPKQAEAS